MTIQRLRITVSAQQVKPVPPIGPMMGQRGVNIKEFCNQANTSTQNIVAGIPVVMDIVILENRSLKCIAYTTTMSHLLQKIGYLSESRRAIYELAVWLMTNDSRYVSIPIQSIVRTIVSIKQFQRNEHSL